jgi:alkylation response protein AidB-like acyl-CoA dehydrogenase
MDFNYTAAQEMLRNAVAEFLKKECPFETVREIQDSEEGYSPKLWSKMAKLEWMGVYFPEKYDGFGDSFVSAMIILEEMGKRQFPSPFCSTVVDCGLILLESNDEKQMKKLLPKIVAGKLIMALAMFEEEASYLPSSISMPAEKTENGYVLNGTKLFVKDANIANQMIVAARTGNGVSMFVVDTKAPGVIITKMCSIGNDNLCEVKFSNVAVAKEDLLGREDMAETFIEAVLPKMALAECSWMLGACKTAIDKTAEYARGRVQYDVPIGAQQAIQHRLADMKMAYDNCYNYFCRLTWMIENGMDIYKDASALKGRLNEQYNFIALYAVRIHGAVGLTREFDVSLFYRDAKSAEFRHGDTAFHYERAAQGIFEAVGS